MRVRETRFRRPSLVNLSVVVALHMAVIAALLVYAPTRRAIAEAAPVFVRFIQPEVMPLQAPPAPPKQAEPEKPKPVVKPKPVAKPAPVTPPVLAAAPSPSAPTVQEVPAAPPKPEAEPPSAPPAAAAVAAVPSVTAPSFNADYLRNPVPPYPSLSRRLGEEGRVMLRVYVDPTGNAERVELRTSSGFPRLDEVALDTVRRWKFVPARRGDEPVAAWVLVPISFSLKG